MKGNDKMATPRTVMQQKSRVYNNPGNFSLIRHAADGTNSTDPEDNLIVTDVIDSITMSYAVETEDRPDGNSLDPAEMKITGRDATITIVMNSMDVDLYSFVTGAVKVIEENKPFYRSGDKQTVKKVGESYQVELLGAIQPDSNVVVKYNNDNTPFTIVEAAPQKGEVSVDFDTGILTFNADDENAVITSAYYFLAPVKEERRIKAKPVIPAFQLNIVGVNTGLNEANPVLDNIIVDTAVVTGETSPLPREKGASTQQTITFKVTSPRGDNDPIVWQMTDVEA